VIISVCVSTYASVQCVHLCGCLYVYRARVCVSVISVYVCEQNACVHRCMCICAMCVNDCTRGYVSVCVCTNPELTAGH